MVSSTSSRPRLSPERWCSTSRTFRLMPARIAVSPARAPGRSIMTMRRTRYRPAADRPWSIRLMSRRGSTLPPEIRATAGPSARIFPARMAARPTAPAGSTTALARSRSSSMARLISSSSTVTTSSTYARDVGEGQLARWPARRSRRPWSPTAAAPRGGRRRARVRMVGAPAASTPTTRTPSPGVGEGGGHAGQQAAPADGHDDHLGVGHLFGQLESDRPLPGDDQGIVEGRHVDRPGAVGVEPGQRPCCRRPPRPPGARRRRSPGSPRPWAGPRRPA